MSCLGVSPEFMLIGVVFLCCAVFFFCRGKDSVDKDAESSEGKGVPCPDTEEEYRLGMDPCSSGKMVMYTLQTCVHCVHLKRFLDAQGLECLLVYVDDFEGEQRNDVMAKLRSFNPRGSFPTLVLPDGRVIVGFRERLVRETLGLD